MSFALVVTRLKPTSTIFIKRSTFATASKPFGGSVIIRAPEVEQYGIINVRKKFRSPLNRQGMGNSLDDLPRVQLLLIVLSNLPDHMIEFYREHTV